MVIYRKGIWRIIEAVFAVLIVVSGLLIFSLNEEPADTKNLSNSIQSLLKEIASNASLREKIVADNESLMDAENNIGASIASRIENPRINFTVSICNISVINCGNMQSTSREVYSQERVISSTINNDNSKILKIYFWID